MGLDQWHLQCICTLYMHQAQGSAMPHGSKVRRRLDPRRRRALTRQRVLAEALRLFESEGPEAMTMRRLARPYAIGGLLAAVVGAVGAIALRVADPVPVVLLNVYGNGTVDVSWLT